MMLGLIGLALGLIIGGVMCRLHGREKDRSWAIALEAVNRSWQEEPISSTPPDQASRYPLLTLVK